MTALSLIHICYYYGSGSITEFDGDGQLTSAISKVTGQETKKVYLASGHGETELSATMTSLMTKSAVETEDLDLFMTEEIPEDCDMPVSYTHLDVYKRQGDDGSLGGS